MRWRHVSLNAARARGCGGDRSVPSRGGGRNFRSHKGPMVRKMGSGGRASKRSRGGDEGGPRVELEYEQEEELEEEEAAAAAVW